MQNGGIFNDVGHYHMHVFPRFKNDGFGWSYGEKECTVSKAIVDEIKKLIDGT